MASWGLTFDECGVGEYLRETGLEAGGGTAKNSIHNFNPKRYARLCGDVNGEGKIAVQLVDDER